MTLPVKSVSWTSGALVILTTAALAQQGTGAEAAARAAISPASASSLVVSGYLDVIDRSDASALRDGVLESMELQVGDQVKKGTHIAWLHKKAAELATAKAKLIAENEGEIAKARAQRGQALATYTRGRRLWDMGPGNISQDELDKLKADLLFADALLRVAEETKEVNQAEYRLQEQIEKRHEITAMIDGEITEVLKRPGERVGANEAVVRIVGIKRLRFIGFVPIEAAFRMKVGDLLQIRPTIEGIDSPVERMTFPAKVTFISPEVQVLGKTEVQIHAELENPVNERGEHLLRTGLKAEATLNLGSSSTAAVGSTR